MSASFQTVRISKGLHQSPDDGACVMELASMLAGEPFSDHPRTASNSVGAFLRSYNDRLDDDRRQTLRPLAAAVVGTAADRVVERQRREFLRDAYCRADVRWSAQLTRVLRYRLMSVGTLGRYVGDRVVLRDDDALHDRTLEIVEAALAVGRPHDALVADELLTSLGSRSPLASG